jgi:carboxymethylenebutenolidase
MPGTDIRIGSSEGGEFDVYLATPDHGRAASAIVLASAIHGVDDDIRGIADEFAARGYLAAAPDLFWRVLPGPLARTDARAALRGQPRLERIETGERDLADLLCALRKQPLFTGRAVVLGFCYSGPYAILGPKRLGYHAGLACHGSQMLDYLADLEGARQPLCIVWGDQDHLAPKPVRDGYRALTSHLPNLEVHVLAGVRHGYMMRGNAAAFDGEAYRFTMECAFAVLESLRTTQRPAPF